MTPLNHWSYVKAPNGFIHLTLNVKDGEMNLLSFDVFQELDRVLGEISMIQARGLLLVSGKPDQFVAGANVNEIFEMKTAQEGEEGSRKAQAIFQKLATLPFPSLAVIHGPCLGGGLELALACTYRVATDYSKTALAAPEVQLGLLPGAGGSVRLPRLLGLASALDLMLTGKRLNAKRAFKIGLVDAVIPAFGAVAYGEQWLEKFLKGERPRTRPHGLMPWLMGTPLGRWVVVRTAKKQVLKKTKGLYPAPLKILEVASAACTLPLAEAFACEAKGFGALTPTPESKALIHLFFATTSKKGRDPLGAKARPVHHVGVVGAGLMGAGITSVLIEKGWRVRLKDVSVEALGRARRAVEEHLFSRKREAVSKYSPMLKLTTATDASGYGTTDVLIEAVFEDLALKQSVLKEFDALARPDAIFATNTSTLSIADIASSARHPSRVIGMHFFSPVPKMPLVEVIVGKGTDPDVTATVVGLAKGMGKQVIVVNDGMGFYVNRPLSLYIIEAVRMAHEGAAIDAVDQAMRAFGFPMGPFEVFDEVGWEVAVHANAVLVKAFGDRFKSPLDFAALVKEKRLGRKSGRGFYLYQQGKKGPRPVDPAIYHKMSGRTEKKFERRAIQDRLVTAFVEESQRCLKEGILRSEDDGDVGAVFGVGFPPHLGGPFWFARHFRGGARTDLS